jgi:hypothetical protein
MRGSAPGRDRSRIATVTTYYGCGLKHCRARYNDIGEATHLTPRGEQSFSRRNYFKGAQNRSALIPRGHDH